MDIKLYLPQDFVTRFAVIFSKTTYHMVQNTQIMEIYFLWNIVVIYMRSIEKLPPLVATSASKAITKSNLKNDTHTNTTTI